jgi:hypothetical protein
VVPVIQFALLSIVNTSRVVVTDPLTPAMKVKFTILRYLIAREIRGANEKEMRLKARLGQSPGQVSNPSAQTSSMGVPIRTLEAEQYESNV